MESNVAYLYKVKERKLANLCDRATLFPEGHNIGDFYMQEI